jgi:hypothetical protein
MLASQLDQIDGCVGGDFDGDGKRDLALITEGHYTKGAYPDSSVIVLRGQGDGTFAAPSFVPVTGGAISIATGDWNGDGRLDLVVGAQDGSLWMLAGRGNGGFDPSPIPNGPYGRYGAPQVADLDGDGKLDLLTWLRGWTLGVLLGRGDGTFQPPSAYATGGGFANGAPYYVWLHVADIDGDGKRDLVTVNPWGPAILRGLGGGRFIGGIAAPADTALALAAGDFDEDGRLDLVTNGPANAVTLSFGTASKFARRLASASLGGGAIILVVADFNHDGHLDIAGADATGVHVITGHGDGTFGAPTSAPLPSRPIDLITSDIDRDGNLDLGSGAPTSAPLPSRPIDMINSDIDRDGSLPRVTTPQSTLTLSSVAAADLDGDGIVDLAAGHYEPGADNFTGGLLLYPGQGDGRFAAPVELLPASPLPVRSVLATDVDGNGRADLVAIGESQKDASWSDSVIVFLARCDGSQAPSSRTPLPVQSGTDRATIGDLDGNGLPDLVIVGSGNIGDELRYGCTDVCMRYGVLIVPNLGNGRFGDPVGLPIGNIESAVVGDFDGDGRPDIAASNYDSLVFHLADQ